MEPSRQTLGFRAPRWRGKLSIPRHAHPIVRRLFEEMNEQQTVMEEVGKRAGLKPETLSNWRYRTNPKLDLIDAALNALDLELCVRKRKTP